MKKQPETTARTRKRMVDAFWSIASEKAISKITVSEITKLSHLNRGTFYEYFLDINELIDYAESEIITDYQRQMESIFSTMDEFDIRTISNKMVELITGCDDKLFILFGPNGDPNFATRIKTEMCIYYKKIFHSAVMDQYADYVISYMVSGIVGLITYWHDSGKKIPPSELADVIFHLASNGCLGWIQNYGIEKIP